MARGKPTGVYVNSLENGKQYRGFVPHPLPRHLPLQLTADDFDLLSQAENALGQLNGLIKSLPDVSLFTYFTVRQEALAHLHLVSIEVAPPSFAELLLHIMDVPLQNVNEIQSHLTAVNHGLKQLRQGLPLSLPLLCELHGMMMTDESEAAETRGQFRRSALWLGSLSMDDALIVLASPEKVLECMSALEKFLGERADQTSVLIRAAMTHAQFVTIRPFDNGNGRMGRLLITLLLCAEGALSEPVLYLCSYFNKHRQTYNDLLHKIHFEGDWENFLRFMLAGVWETAEQNSQIVREILALFRQDERQIKSLSRSSTSAIRVHQYLQTSPCVSIPAAAQALALSIRTVTTALASLEKLGIVRKLAGRQGSRLFVYDGYLKILMTPRSTEIASQILSPA